ncbi:hypothetical protein [Turkeypox virus]|uniref:Uncharacterized protein n=1 Tax=Turkeypox virus TaxID=336486 RepID=A0A0M3ZK04_9POXV|nr:hypothetical protein ASN15_gp045 [Turkeypox virus]ALA62419.1 hypothetical protein [Turkeypox virus]
MKTKATYGKGLSYSAIIMERLHIIILVVLVINISASALLVFKISEMLDKITLCSKSF